MLKQTKYDKLIKPLIACAIIVVAFITITTLENMVTTEQDHEITQLKDIITYEVNRVVEVHELVESYQTTILESTSKEILNSLKDQNLADLTSEDLATYLDKYPITGLALFKDTGDDIIIENSTSSVEIGLSTNKWGFWYQAFRQLFDQGYVSLNKGTSKDAFWIGPRSKAYEQEGFFIFSYEKIPNQPYLLNIYIDDKKAFDATNTLDTNEIFTKIVEESNFIEEIAIINVDAWNNRFQHEYRSKLQDYTIEYGTYKAFSAEDTYYLNNALSLELQESITLGYSQNAQKYSKQYTKLSDYEILIFVLNKKSQELMRYHITRTVILGLAAIWFLGYIYTRYHNKHLSLMLTIEKERLKIAESYKQTVQILPSVVLRLNIVDKELIIHHCEGKASRLLGMDSELIKGQKLQNYLPENYLGLIWEHLAYMDTSDSSRFEYKFKERIFENKIEWVHAPSTKKKSPNDEFIVLWNDITDLRLSEDKARFMAYHDHLTQLPNRRYFKESVKLALSNTSNTFYLAFIDLDGFKQVNDVAGHDIGDELLVEIANKLSASLSGQHLVARMGGDEFAVLFNEVASKEALENIIQQLKNSISKNYRLGDHNFNIGMSMGISESNKDGNDYVTLLKKADIALYEVKFSTKGTHKFYNDSMNI